MHQLWIGYMSELLGLSLVVPLSIIPSIENASTSSTSALLPMFPNRSAVDLTNHPSTSDLKINVGVLQGKLVKAELIGCLLLGECSFLLTHLKMWLSRWMNSQKSQKPHPRSTARYRPPGNARNFQDCHIGFKDQE